MKSSVEKIKPEKQNRAKHSLSSALWRNLKVELQREPLSERVGIHALACHGPIAALRLNSERES